MKTIILLIIIFNKFALAEVISIENIRLKELLNKGIKIVDVREKDELVLTGIIENSYIIPLLNRNARFNFNEWFHRFLEVKSNEKSVIFVCARGVRSSYIARLISERLPKLRIYNLKKGIDDWIRSGNLLVKY